MVKLVLLLLFLSLFPSFRRRGLPTFAGGQLYSNFEDNAKIHSLPLAFTDSTDYEEAAKRSDPKAKEQLKTLTCLAKIPIGWRDVFPVLAETRDYFRSRVLYSNYNPHYFCSNVPKFNRRFGPPKATVGEGHATPHSKFWMHEPTAWHWSHRADPAGGKATGKILMESKDMGFIFTVDVTGIRGKGGFLKGWYHLKIKLDIDHNIKNPLTPNLNDYRGRPNLFYDPFLPFEDPVQRDAKAAEYLENYVIDKLIVTARGRILIPGKNQEKTDEIRPPRRAWVGGIGEFVRDFPKCEEDGYNSEYVPQQFMPCGAVQYSESKYGNNFYYSRGVSGGHPKYGKGQGERAKEIHLNFRLDNTFCNRYYDLDFIANGMVMHKDTQIELEGFDTLDSPYARIFPKPPVIYVVQRSISTRFAFISSHSEHGPTYYENADPIPRGVNSVICSERLEGLWKMGDPIEPHPFQESDQAGAELRETDKPPEPDSHTSSVTQGAALIPNPDADKDATSSFSGSLKFIYSLPNSSSLRSGTDSNFAGRRTWTYSDVFLFPGPGVPEDHSFWDAWTDWKEFKNVLKQKSRTIGPGTKIAILTAVQRILHEFDWESWRQKSRTLSARRHGNAPDVARPTSWQVVGFPNSSVDTTPRACRGKLSGFPPYHQGNCQGWCDVHDGNNANIWNSQAERWPHPYYDATCVGLDIWNIDNDGDLHSVRDLINTYELGSLNSRLPTRFEREYPPILGRCRPNLYYNSGIGRLSTAPPVCNEFFSEHRKKRIVDPALDVVISSTDQSSRHNWMDKYGEGGSFLKQQAVICKLVDVLNKAYPKCPSIPPNPFTSTPSPILVAKKAKDFKTTRAYNRGMMVAESPYSLFVYDSRVLHGMVMTIIVMFITPVSIFLARYYKETFMDSRVLFHRIWYFVHLGAALLTPLLFIVALFRLSDAKALLGVSLSRTGTLHRLLGWVSIIIAALMASLGGIRCMHRTLRGFIIFLHCILGFGFYFISLGLIMISVAIPGSPSASLYDFSIVGTANNGEKKGAELKYLGREPIFLILVGWIVFDLLINILLTVMQCVNDSSMDLTQPRICFGAGMPILSENFRFDSPGRFLRIWALRLYVIVSFGVTIAICILIRLNSPRGRGYGFMSCTHNSTTLDVLLEYGADCIRDRGSDSKELD